MLKTIFIVFLLFLMVILAVFVFRFFYLKGLLTLKPTPLVFPSRTTTSPTITNAGTTKLTPTISSSPTPSPLPRTKLVRIDVDDTAAGMYQLSLKRGTKVILTLRVMTFNVNFGGLDFRSPIVNTGVIPPGQTKTVEFIANESFFLVPYYPQTNLPAPYRLEFLIE